MAATHFAEAVVAQGSGTGVHFRETAPLDATGSRAGGHQSVSRR